MSCLASSGLRIKITDRHSGFYGLRGTLEGRCDFDRGEGYIVRLDRGGLIWVEPGEFEEVGE